MSDINSKDENIDNDVNTSSETNEKRRRLVTGLTAAPILLSLASKPVLGTYTCAPSGFMSGNLSNPDVHKPCGGHSPKFWCNNYNWSPYKHSGCAIKNPGNSNCQNDPNQGGTLCKDAFRCKGRLSHRANKTMLHCMKNKPSSLHALFSAALLNCNANLPGYVVTTKEIKGMASQYDKFGYCRTSNGVKMYKTDIKKFLKNICGA